MARFAQRPENALKRANEFIEVGKPARALDTLTEVFRNKKWTYNWSESVLEPIMFKYLDLCVGLKKSHIAKEGLFQYRNMFQSVNVGSLENVIRGYLRMAEEKTDAARKQSQQAVVEIDDLDNLVTPESILLSAVSGEDAQDRSDRTILTPWVKFLWESYCQCLELLRTNAHCEILYHDIARMAFQFCLDYQRKTEFRKLCEKLRKHLEDISKLPPLVSNVSINKLETQQLNLETRLTQLDFAIQMELWQEAYKAIEDIHGLMNLSKKMPVPKTMANYYQKLAMVFWKAGNNLFHAAALFKLFQLSRDMKKNMSSEEQQKMANKVLLATLSIPLPSARPEFDRFIETDKSPQEKAQKLAVLLGLSQPPSRASLIKDIVRLGVVSLAAPPLQDLYSWLEVEYHPLELCEKVNTVIQNLQQEEFGPLSQYVPALQDLTLVRLLHQVSQAYQTIKIARLLELAKFSSLFEMERIIVDCVRYKDMQISVDAGKQRICFGVDLSKAHREDNPDGPILQPMPSEQIHSQLVNMITVLHRADNIIYPQKKKQELDKLRTAEVNHYHDTKVQEHQRILGRQKLIEEYKEYMEQVNIVKEREEMQRQEELQRQQLMAEQKRLEQEREERERKRQQSEIQQIKERTLKEKMAQISQTSHGQKVLKKLDDEEMKKMDAEQIAAREAEELMKERKELQQKLKSQEKKVDHLERAKHLEEITLLQQAMEEKVELAKKRWEQQEAERIQSSIEERSQAVANRERLSKMKDDISAFITQISAGRKSIYEDKLKKFEEMKAEVRAKRLVERKLQRRIDRELQWERQKAEAAEKKRLAEQEEERKRMEEERAKREQEEKIRRAEEEAKEAERLVKLEKQAAIKRSKELEIEARLEEDKKKNAERPVMDSWRSKTAAAAAAGGGGGGGADTWRKPRDDRDRRGDMNKSSEPSGGDRWKPSGERNFSRNEGGSSFSRFGDRDRDRDGDRRGDRRPDSYRGSRDSNRDRPSDRRGYGRDEESRGGAGGGAGGGTEMRNWRTPAPKDPPKDADKKE